jgi:hypothetical protein
MNSTMRPVTLALRTCRVLIFAVSCGESATLPLPVPQDLGVDCMSPHDCAPPLVCSYLWADGSGAPILAQICSLPCQRASDCPSQYHCQLKMAGVYASLCVADGVVPP